MINNIKRIVAQYNILKNLILRNFKMKYAGSSLGIFWAFLNPLFLMFAITFVFSVVLKIDIENFYLFVLSTIFPWLVFSISVSESSHSILNQAQVLKQFNIAPELLSISAVAANFLNFLIGWSVVIIFFVIMNHSAIYYMPMLALLVVLQFFFTSGVGLVVSTLNVFRRDIGKLVEILLMLMMWMTPVFYSIHMVPRNYQWLLWINPMTPFIVAYRSLLLNASIPTGYVCGGIFLWTIASLLVGFLVFNKLEKRLVKRV